MSGNSWIVKKPRPGAPSGSGSSAFQVTIVEEPVTWEHNGTDTESMISSEADIGESCSNSVPGSCDESQESSGHRNNSPGQFDTPRPSTMMKPPKIPPLACPPRWNRESEAANNTTQLGFPTAMNTRSYHDRGSSEHTSENGAEQFSLGEKSTVESTPYLTPRLGWKEDVDRPPTPDRNGFEVPIARKPFVGERDLGPNSSSSKSSNPLALNIPPKEQQETAHGQVNSPKQSADSDEVAQLSARLGSPLPEDFYQSTNTASSNEPRRYSNLIFERAQDFLMGWMVQHPPGTSDSVKMASPFSMSSNEGGSSSGQLESEVTVSDLVQPTDGVPRQDSPVVLPRLTPLIPEGRRHALPEITEIGKQIEEEEEEESETDQEPEDIGRNPSIPRSAGARERINHSERWEDDDDSFLELSINTKSDSGTTETFCGVKLHLDESGNDQVLASRPSANRDLPPALPSRRSSKSVTGGRPPRPQQSQDAKSKRADATRLANMLQHQDSEDLFRDTAKVREYVRALQSIARTGSISSVRRALGVEEPESDISEIRDMVDALEAGDHTAVGSGTSSEDNAARKLTMFWDAEEESPDGPVFWKEETADEVKRMATSMIGEAEDYYSIDIDETNGSERGRCEKVGGNQKFDDEVRLLTSNQFAAVAEQLREVIKVKSSKLDVDESGEFSGRSGSERAASKDQVESEVGTGKKNRKNELQGTSQSSGKRTPTTRKGFQKLTSFFRRRTSKSQGSGSSFSSRSDTPRQIEQPPPPLNTVEEAPSDASCQITLPPVLEPHGSGSAIQTPHPLEDVMSTRNDAEDCSAKSLGGFATGRSGEVSTKRSSAVLPTAYTHSSKSIDSGKSESSLEERFYMLKKDENSPPPDGHPPPRNTASACSEATGSREVKSTHISRVSSHSCPEIPDIEGIDQISLQKPQGYTPTNDIDSILQESKVDVFRLRGPLTDSQLKSVLSVNGKWKADWDLSDSYDSLCEVMELGWVFKKGLENSDTLIFESNAKECKSIAKVAGLVNLTEKRPWNQSVVVHRRRDLRRGPCRCWAERYDGGIILRMDWDNPVGGTCYEFIELTEDRQTMVLRQELFRKNDGPSSIVRMVFRRSE